MFEGHILKPVAIVFLSVMVLSCKHKMVNILTISVTLFIMCDIFPEDKNTRKKLT
jgi:hypothetical protein